MIFNKDGIKGSFQVRTLLLLLFIIYYRYHYYYLISFLFFFSPSFYIFFPAYSTQCQEVADENFQNKSRHYHHKVHFLIHMYIIYNC